MAHRAHTSHTSTHTITSAPAPTTQHAHQQANNNQQSAMHLTAHRHTILLRTPTIKRGTKHDTLWAGFVPTCKQTQPESHANLHPAPTVHLPIAQHLHSHTRIQPETATQQPRCHTHITQYKPCAHCTLREPPNTTGTKCGRIRPHFVPPHTTHRTATIHTQPQPKPAHQAHQH